MALPRPPSSNSSTTLFGVVFVMDDPLTVSPDNTSKVVGRAQGVSASASQKDVSLLLAFNFFFTEGKYNGSMLSVLWRNAPLEDLRELPILGGSGLFRFAQGYAHARTHYLDIVTGDAIVKYDVYVLHY
ncbi:hypothetical protein MLD38_036452 [Melastoma candidum]|uniref:Uncharacterized protein n=1 Tax=Melastoma candidum TaxID=119954 RepID=A0ACB9LJ36_9MYRT|nr:hypothetical protein MLD38_036452 [Melastoma candidum]